MDEIVYTVHGADTLWGIAREQLGDPMLYKSIKEWNDLPGLALKPGQKLKLKKRIKEKNDGDVPNH